MMRSKGDSRIGGSNLVVVPFLVAIIRFIFGHLYSALARYLFIRDLCGCLCDV